MIRTKYKGEDIDANETKCQHCGQIIPIRGNGTMVRHYSRVKNSTKQKICKGGSDE